MRLSTEIIRTAYGFTETACNSAWYEDALNDIRKKQLQKHRSDCEWFKNDSRFLSSVSGHYSEEDRGAIECEWWTVIVLDLDRA